jgi:hypothetical protein
MAMRKAAGKLSILLTTLRVDDTIFYRRSPFGMLRKAEEYL